MAENDGKSGRRGRPASEIPLKPWGAYVEAVAVHRPGAPHRAKDLLNALRKLAPNSVHETIDTFRAVLRGQRPALKGFAAALITVLGLRDLQITVEDFELPLDAFQRRLALAAPSDFEKDLERAQDGTTLRLRRQDAGEPMTGHMGRNAAPLTVLTPGVLYGLEITRPLNADGIAGPTVLLGYGYDDKVWQLISAVSEPPLPPSRKTSWGRLTGVSMRPTLQRGRFLLLVVASKSAFSPALTAMFEGHIGGDGYLSDQEVLAMQAELLDKAKGLWTAKLKYTVVE